jgi:hypothetical protein
VFPLTERALGQILRELAAYVPPYVAIRFTLGPRAANWSLVLLVVAVVAYGPRNSATLALDGLAYVAAKVAPAIASAGISVLHEVRESRERAGLSR